MSMNAGPHDFVTSDVHLGAVSAEKEAGFLRFLAHVGDVGSSLLIVGDLFDFWFEYGTVIPGKHYRVLAALADLVRAGIPVRMVGGNHDAWGGRFLREEVGIDFHAGELRADLAGAPALIVHGDGLGRTNRGYRMLRAVLRSRVAVAGFRALHPELGVRIARMVSNTHEKSQHHHSVQVEARQLEAWAMDRLEQEPALRWVVCGHVHRPAIREFQSGRYYINAGDWLYHDSYVRIARSSAPELMYWERDQAATS